MACDTGEEVLSGPSFDLRRITCEPKSEFRKPLEIVGLVQLPSHYPLTDRDFW